MILSSLISLIPWKHPIKISSISKDPPMLENLADSV
jgi:hypothetical protein